ncbi:MAG: multicopper oxidase domain-containing protein [Eubacteriales bacterium]|nr:multicopper oxidase domain-containing protein [Eubacteriales bacterium]MDD4744164.1 multicopper oxidase domain-containing protein [Eubacteriales bacterium]
MSRIVKQRTWLILALLASVLALASIIFLLVSWLYLPHARSDRQNGNELKIPDMLQDQNADPDMAEFVLEAQSGQTNFLGSVMTDTLGYNGSYLGPVLRIRRGEKVTIHVNNRLDFPTTLHWHGLVVDGEQDGGPHQGIQPGESWNPSFTVDQPAATLWYHPHLLGDTADQVYYGLSGLIYIEDEISDQLNLPQTYGQNDIPLIVQDRSFNRDGSLAIRTSMMGVAAGDTLLINGTVNPYLDVAGEAVRFRILNASNAQNMTFRFSDNSRFWQIASDGGFLAAPLIRRSVFLAPGERAEIIVDFSKTTRSDVALMVGKSALMAIHISDERADTFDIPESLTQIEPLPEDHAPNTRIFDLQSMGISGTINGQFFDMNRIDEEVRLGETEIWIIRNRGGMMQAVGHPFHVHGTQFQIISRNGRPPPPHEQGFKDTVFVPIGEEVAIRVRFTHAGLFMYHCHILEHEDNGMMGQFQVS